MPKPQRRENSRSEIVNMFESSLDKESIMISEPVYTPSESATGETCSVDTVIVEDSRPKTSLEAR